MTRAHTDARMLGHTEQHAALTLTKKDDHNMHAYA